MGVPKRKHAMKPALLVILQNPWKRGKLKKWHPSIWRKEFMGSRTGSRLFNEVLPIGLYRLRFTNANPKLADSPQGIFPPNLKHLRRQISKTKPSFILACGNVAKKAICSLRPSAIVISMPHPASHSLSKKTTGNIKQKLIASKATVS